MTTLFKLLIINTKNKNIIFDNSAYIIMRFQLENANTSKITLDTYSEHNIWQHIQQITRNKNITTPEKAAS